MDLIDNIISKLNEIKNEYKEVLKSVDYSINVKQDRRVIFNEDEIKDDQYLIDIINELVVINNKLCNIYTNNDELLKILNKKLIKEFEYKQGEFKIRLIDNDLIIETSFWYTTIIRYKYDKSNKKFYKIDIKKLSNTGRGINFEKYLNIDFKKELLNIDDIISEVMNYYQ